VGHFKHVAPRTEVRRDIRLMHVQLPESCLSSYSQANIRNTASAFACTRFTDAALHSLCRLSPRQCSWVQSGSPAASRPAVLCFKSALDFYVGAVRCTCVELFSNLCFTLHGCFAACSVCLPQRGDVAISWVRADSPHVKLFVRASVTKMLVVSHLPHVKLVACASLV
jgi:hypothetical protein